MSDRRPKSPVLPIAVTLAVLLGQYVGAYYVLVNDFFPAPVPREAYYGDLSRYFEPLFRPIHRLDRLIRPHVWER